MHDHHQVFENNQIITADFLYKKFQPVDKLKFSKN